MEILQNEDFMLLFKNSGIDQCCVIFQRFISPVGVDGPSLFVTSCDFMFVSDAVCSLSCTLGKKKNQQKKKKKDVDFVSGRPGFQIPTPSSLGFNVCVKENKTKKATENKLHASTEDNEFIKRTEGLQLFLSNSNGKKKFVASFYIYQIRLRINFEKKKKKWSALHVKSM